MQWKSVFRLKTSCDITEQKMKRITDHFVESGVLVRAHGLALQRIDDEKQRIVLYDDICLVAV
jgi:hypothetical protein